jgi:hypothetical protein
MKKIFYFFVFSLISYKNAFSEYKLNLNKILNNEKVLNSNQTLKNEEEKTLSLSGGFHFFLSTTNEDQIYEADSIQNMMKTEGYINFLHKNEVDENTSYSISSQIKKKFNNKVRIRNILEIENKNYGKIQISNYRKIQDDLFVNTYWIRAGSNNAWDSNINLKLNENNIQNNHIKNGVLTGYDTALTNGADTDSATIAYYTPNSNPIIFGISYTPKVYYGEIKNPLFNYRDIFTTALMYNKDINEKTNIKISALTEIGAAARNEELIDRKISELKAIHFGSIMQYSNFSIAGNIGFFGNSGHIAKISIDDGKIENFSKANNSHYYDLTTAYNINKKTKLSFSYFHSTYAQDYPIKTDDNSIITGQANLQNISLALDYKLYGDTFKPYIEINKFTISDNDALVLEKKNKDNDGWVFVVGAKSVF